MPTPTNINTPSQIARFEISALDTDFPTVLRQTHPPVGRLFGLGSRALIQQLFENPGLAIVGSRQATAQGCADARWFAREASAAGLTVISGLAQGIDAAAHLGGLDGPGLTVAILGHGRDSIYPKQHQALAEQITRQGGCLLTEYADQTPAIAHHFPNRNRIIAGLSRAILVVEATPQSGSLITARHALELGIDVFVVPGSIHMPQSLGCNMLIRQGAQPVISPEQLLQDLNIAPPAPSRQKIKSSRIDGQAKIPGLAPAHEVTLPVNVNQELAHRLTAFPQTVGVLEGLTGISAPRLYGELLLLELNGLASRTPDGKWLKFSSK